MVAAFGATALFLSLLMLALSLLSLFAAWWSSRH